MIYSVCIDNRELKRIRPIYVDLETLFLNLLFDSRKAKEKGFAGNEKHWQYTDMDDSFRTVNMNVYLDDNDYITSIDFYKYQPTSFNHGKNSVKEFSVTTADRKKLLAVLQEVVVDPSEDELAKLLSALEQSEYGQERQLQVRKNDVSLLDQNGTAQKVKIKTILKAIQISHVYLEILHNDRLFQLFPKDFPPEICPMLREILAFVDTDQYYRLDELRCEMSMREVIAGAEDNYPLLRQAAMNGDVDKVRELTPYAKLVPVENPEGSPLYHAVKGNHYEIVKILLENGAYSTEMDRDGSRYPLELAYQNGNRDLVRLLLAYHGATSRISGSDNVKKLCAANKDYEVLELMAPDAYTLDTRTWLTPDLFPDMEEETIRALSRCRNIRIAWGLEQIRPVYERKEYDLCRNMLLQGSAKGVPDFFAAQNDYEMFEASVQCHAMVYVSKETCSLVFERGGKWFDTLAKHTMNLKLEEDMYFARLLDNGGIDRYLQIMETRGCSFKGLGGYMVWPEKVTEPKKYIDLVRLVIRKGEPCSSRRLFLEDIVRLFGDEQLAKEYFGTYPLNADIDWVPFRINNLIPYYILRTNNPYAGAELLRSYFAQDVENKTNKAFHVVTDLIVECSGSKPVEMVDDDSVLDVKEQSCLYMLRVLLSFVPIQEIDELFAQAYARDGIKSAYDFATHNGRQIRSRSFLVLLRNGR